MSLPTPCAQLPSASCDVGSVLVPVSALFCVGDYVQVYDGADMNAPRILDVTEGTELPTSVVSTAGRMYVHFSTGYAGPPPRL